MSPLKFKSNRRGAFRPKYKQITENETVDNLNLEKCLKSMAYNQYFQKQDEDVSTAGSLSWSHVDLQASSKRPRNMGRVKNITTVRANCLKHQRRAV